MTVVRPLLQRVGIESHSKACRQMKISFCNAPVMTGALRFIAHRLSICLSRHGRHDFDGRNCLRLRQVGYCDRCIYFCIKRGQSSAIGHVELCAAHNATNVWCYTVCDLDMTAGCTAVDDTVFCNTDMVLPWVCEIPAPDITYRDGGDLVGCRRSIVRNWMLQFKNTKESMYYEFIPHYRYEFFNSCISEDYSVDCVQSEYDAYCGAVLYEESEYEAFASVEQKIDLRTSHLVLTGQLLDHYKAQHKIKQKPST